MKIVVIDGQGGKIGAAVVEGLLKKGCDGAELLAVGTNSIATAAMLKAGAPNGATGENPVAVACADADVIVGPIGILAANSLHGEITSRMALAISESRARKVLIPTRKCKIEVMGTQELSLGEYISLSLEAVFEHINS